MKTSRILAAAVFAALATTVYAGQYGPGPHCMEGAAPALADCPKGGPGGMGHGRHGAHFQERLKAADKDGNGMISREEAQGAMPRLYERFDEIDVDKDGQVSVDEMRAARQRHHAAGQRGEGWKQWDANGDGKLSREEVAKAPRLSGHFDAIDVDKDGFLTVEELRAAHRGRGGRGPQG